MLLSPARGRGWVRGLRMSIPPHLTSYGFSEFKRRSVSLAREGNLTGRSRLSKAACATITSYPVGRHGDPDPNTAWLRSETVMGRTLLSRRYVRPRLGPVTAHPVRPQMRSSVSEGVPALCLEDGIGRQQSRGDEAPQRDHQLAGQGHDGDAPDPATLLTDTVMEPSAERAFAAGSSATARRARQQRSALACCRPC